MLKRDNVSKSLRTHPPGAFTLVELVVSLAITSILLVTIASSVVIASYAIPDGTEKSSVVIASGRGLDQLLEELRYALSIREQTARSLEFTVADRNGDIREEVIRYAWTGVAGDSLTRQYNGGAIVPVVENVQDFTFGYQTLTYQKQDPTVESAEVVLADHSASVKDVPYRVSVRARIGQFFMPSNLDPMALSWKVTRVLVQLQNNGPAVGETLLQLRTPTIDNLPGPTIYEQLTLLEADLQATFFWEEYLFTNVDGIPPDQGLCLVFKWVSDANSLEVQYDRDSGAGLLLSNDNGVSWTISGMGSLNYSVFGTYTTMGASVYGYALICVDITLVTTDSGKGKVVLYASAPTLNTPEVLTP